MLGVDGEVKNIVYYSITGNTKAFANKMVGEGYKVASLKEAQDIDEPYIIFSPTYNFGQIPIQVKKFLDKNKTLLRGVVGFGNLNWGEFFCSAGKQISSLYHVPLLGMVEMRGTEEDLTKIKETMQNGVYEVTHQA